MTSVMPLSRIVSATDLPWETRTSTCRSFATIFSDFLTPSRHESDPPRYDKTDLKVDRCIGGGLISDVKNLKAIEENRRLHCFLAEAMLDVINIRQVLGKNSFTPGARVGSGLSTAASGWRRQDPIQFCGLK